MAVALRQDDALYNSDTFLLAHPEIQVGRIALENLQSTHTGSDSFSIINKPFRILDLYQEFDADTKERIYVVALVGDQKALNDHARDCGETDEGEKCDCAENHGPDHLIYERVVEYKLANCEKHMEEQEPDPTCSAYWPVFCGSKCTL
jgi:hypothetical protein